jgi:hypothetical protein
MSGVLYKSPCKSYIENETLKIYDIKITVNKSSHISMDSFACSLLLSTLVWNAAITLYLDLVFILLQALFHTVARVGLHRHGSDHAMNNKLQDKIQTQLVMRGLSSDSPAHVPCFINVYHIS